MDDELKKAIKEYSIKADKFSKEILQLAEKQGLTVPEAYGGIKAACLLIEANMPHLKAAANLAEDTVRDMKERLEDL